MVIGIKTIIRRFFELFIINVTASTFAPITYLIDATHSQFSMTLGITIAFVAFVLANICILRRCYFDLRDKQIYYFLNLAAYLLFALLSFIIYEFCPPEIFDWMFAISGFASYIYYQIPYLASIFIFHIIGLVIICLAPIGLYWIFCYDV